MGARPGGGEVLYRQDAVYSSLQPHVLDADAGAGATMNLMPLSRYLRLDMDTAETAELEVPAAVVAKSASWCFDIIPCPGPQEDIHVGADVAPTAVAACFTKAYSRFIRGAGSVLLIDGSGTGGATAAASSSGAGAGAVEPEERVYNSDWRQDLCLTSVAAEGAIADTGGGGAAMPLVVSGRKRLRYFAPRELLNLFGFPPDFQFNPDVSSIDSANTDTGVGESLNTAASNSGSGSGVTSKGGRRVKICPEKPVTRRQSYELIGNSINVTMTTRLLEHMFLVFPLSDASMPL